MGKRLVNLVKPKINHNKTESTASYQTTRIRIRLKILGYFRIALPKIGFITENRLDFITLH